MTYPRVSAKQVTDYSDEYFVGYRTGKKVKKVNWVFVVRFHSRDYGVTSNRRYATCKAATDAGNRYSKSVRRAMEAEINKEKNGVEDNG